jgi:hypothetical protein
MKCWRCDEDARASCKMCGRFVCKSHTAKLSTFISMYLGDQSTPKGLAVANVVWCGLCDPQPEPIPMPELY